MSEGVFEARFIDNAIACRRQANSDADAPDKIFRQREIAAGKDLVHLLIQREERGQRP